jgi:hypothetical protein
MLSFIAANILFFLMVGTVLACVNDKEQKQHKKG